MEFFLGIHIAISILHILLFLIFLFSMLFCFLPFLFVATCHKSTFALLMDAWRNPGSHISFKKGHAPAMLWSRVHNHRRLPKWRNNTTERDHKYFFIYPLIHPLPVNTHSQTPGNFCMDRKHNLPFSYFKAGSWKCSRGTDIYENLAVGN